VVKVKKNKLKKLKIRVPFIGGPVHGVVFEMEWIPQVSMMNDEKERKIHAYLREEMAYFYEEELSNKLSAVYDQAVKKFRINKIVPVA
jgi:hypothetical protein